ncbi:thiamine pyrophosphate-dependent dehydrogenase E1 component subunit alpha [Bdellovibrio bacteriovorus]|uniref:thiamine pyrophosphate-dependent dehydrogenase E1 component subunit alpha n=1 Tax=Bdellovibrio bacteriovorus TaxID=959 RepID=UPI0021CFE564|nr:thiamine pyrophosphate-dependent dehydrogenase E1 component subunit alpha [Bdellovibrio bacteriovorus]UXR65263.1 thiamine pyrophosphate-dependent dehydrogenase E1 component subunit alpha [Bdellovibrio bacteriovorus]
MSKKTTVKTGGKAVAGKTTKKAAKPAAKSTVKTSKKAAVPAKKKQSFGGLSEEILLRMHDLMVKSRVLEERLIKIYKAGEAYFWIGGPGEEAWGVPLGMLARKGFGPENDWLHLHYRCTPTMVAMGMTMIDSIRLMMNRATDPSTGGRNFSSHYCFPEWNVAPVTSPLEVQYPIACGTAQAQKRVGKGALSIVTGGDAGTAEGDFASCLILASRKGQELPVLITVQNNGYGISTPYDGQHGETHIADRARAFNIRSRVINGNDPVETYLALKEEMEYIRKTGKPSFIEAMVTRLYGHSSADGANKKPALFDPVLSFEKRLIDAGILSEKAAKKIWEIYETEGVNAQEQARQEPSPTPESVWDHVYVNNENADWRKF